MVTEAGGLIGNFTGEADYLYQREVVAGSPKIYGQLVGLLSPFSRVIEKDDAVTTAVQASAPALTPETALATGLARGVEVPVETASTPAPVKRPAVRISKESMAREKQAAIEADRKPPRPRAPRGGDAPF